MGDSADANIRSRFDSFLPSGSTSTELAIRSRPSLAEPRAKTDPLSPKRRRLDIDTHVAKLFSFEGDSATGEEVGDHFIATSKEYSGHGTIRKEDEIREMAMTLPEGMRDTKSLCDFRNEEDLVHAYSSEGVETGRRNTAILLGLWGLAHKQRDSLDSGSWFRSPPDDSPTHSDKEDDSSVHRRRKSKRSKKSKDSKKKKKRKNQKGSKSRSRSSSSSSHSSDVRKSLKPKLTKAGVTFIKPSFYANASVLKDVLKAFKRGQQFSSRSFDSFYPHYHGEGLPEAIRNSKTKERKLDTQRRGISAIENAMTFWVTHQLGNNYKFESIIAHLGILFRLSHEEGVPVAAAYERFFISKISDESLCSTIENLDARLAEKDSEVLTSARSHAKNLDSKSTEQPRARIPRRPQEPLSRREPLKRDPKFSGPPGPPNSDSRKGICFFHDTLNRKQCRFGDKCPNIHLDTKSESDKRRFDAAKSAYQSNKDSSGARRPPRRQ